MKTIVEAQHLDHAGWIGKLKSYKGELTALEGRLAEIASTGRKREVLAQVEHFQNQFIVQKSNLNDILHGVKMDEKQMRYEMVMDPVALEARTGKTSRELQVAGSFEKAFTELRTDFNRFVTKYA